MEDRRRLPAGLARPCPGCGNGRLAAVSDGEQTNLLCRSCGSCWHVELGWVDRVDPATCPGCPSRASCEAARLPYGEPLSTLR